MKPFPSAPALTAAERKLFSRLSTPSRIQEFLTALPINFEPRGDTCRSPRGVVRARTAHCLEGALFAAAALWYHGERPLLLDLKSGARDFDHVVALFKKGDRWGAISKTNHAVLRYREPIYRSVRELAASYFHEYFTDDGRKTLRSHSGAFSLVRFGTDWITQESDLWDIGAALDDAPHVAFFPRGAQRSFRRADAIEIEAGKLTEYKQRI